MARLVLYDKKGMTLIEVMFSVVLLMIVAMAVMQTALVGMNANLQNSLRDEAVKIVDQRMEELRSLTTGTSFDTINTGADPVISRNFRSASVNYSPTRTVSSIDFDTKQVIESVSWSFRGRPYTHSATTIMRRQ